MKIIIKFLNAKQTVNCQLEKIASTMTEDISRFEPLIGKFVHIKEKYGDNYPIVVYEPAINCQEKKVLSDLIQGNNSIIHLFGEFKEASQFVQSLGISFILIVPSDFDEEHVLENFQTLGNVHGRAMFDFEEEALFKDLFQSLSGDLIKSLRIKAFVFVTLLDFMIKAPINKEGEEEVMMMRDLKDMAKELRQDFVVLWYDPKISTESKMSLEEKIELRIEENNIFLDVSELYQMINSYTGTPYHLIFLGRDKAERIIKDMDNFRGLLGLYIYDDNSQEMSDEKVEIKKTLEELIPKIKEGFRTRSKLVNTFPSFATNFDALDKTEIFNMHYYLKGLIKFDNRKQAKGDFIQLARRIYQDNDRNLMRFETEYDQFNAEKIFYWYTKDSPVYRVLNNCLRIASSDSILYSRFVLRELERAIRE